MALNRSDTSAERCSCGGIFIKGWSSRKAKVNFKWLCKYGEKCGFLSKQSRDEKARRENPPAKASSMFSVLRLSAALFAKAKVERFTHDILHWAGKKFVWRAKSCSYGWSISRSNIRYSLYAGKASLQLLPSNSQFRDWARIRLQFVHSPGLRALLSRSSSSSAASTADFARFPVRVVDGSSKSILFIDRERVRNQFHLTCLMWKLWKRENSDDASVK